ARAVALAKNDQPAVATNSRRLIVMASLSPECIQLFAVSADTTLRRLDRLLHSVAAGPRDALTATRDAGRFLERLPRFAGLGTSAHGFSRRLLSCNGHRTRDAYAFSSEKRRWRAMRPARHFFVIASATDWEALMQLKVLLGFGEFNFSADVSGGASCGATTLN
ncbi:MAG TPA: hypothetical protein VI653_26375, partial [Steroidobacteraceae bacterium]